MRTNLYFLFIISFCFLFVSNSSLAQSDTANTGFRVPGMTRAQKMIASTGEDLLSGNNAEEAQTVLSGYGEFVFKYDTKYKDATAALSRGVIFLGHQFSNRIAFFSELEIEDAKIEGGKLQGSIGFEQLFLKFSINPRNYITAGLLLPRIGILNENHLPINYSGTERAMVEQFVIPSTWRELGVAYYGQMSTAPITYSLAVINGINAGNLEHGTGLVGGRGEGQNVSFNNIAVTGSVQAYVNNFKIQVSGYVGGTLPLSSYQADSLQVAKGLFAAPLYLGEANIQYTNNGFYGKALGAYVSLPDASEINTLYANNTPENMYGAYLELGYDLLYSLKNNDAGRQLIAFGRYEKMNVNNTIPDNGIIDGTLDQSHIVVGLNYLPLNNVVIKADVRFTHTGSQNKAIFLNPPPVMIPYQQDNAFINIGLGYSF